MYISVVVVVLGAYAYYECDLYKHYEVYGATLLGVTVVLNKNGYQEQGGKLKLVTTRVIMKRRISLSSLLWTLGYNVLLAKLVLLLGTITTVQALSYPIITVFCV